MTTLQTGGMTSLKAIGVIGAGTMGTGNAQACALAGLSVSILDVAGHLGRKSGRGFYTYS
jgi:3-hydroxyacyl-CoA dehydrogenase